MWGELVLIMGLVKWAAQTHNVADTQMEVASSFRHKFVQHVRQP